MSSPPAATTRPPRCETRHGGQTARDEWDRTEKAMFPHRRPEMVRFVEVFGAENERVARAHASPTSSPSAAGIPPTSSPTSCWPTTAARASSRSAWPTPTSTAWPAPSPIPTCSSARPMPARTCRCCARRATRRWCSPATFANAATSPSKQAVYQLTGRQAEVFGFNGRGVIAAGNVADLAVFALDELHYDNDEFVYDLPGGGSRLRRPEGGYRATFVDGVPCSSMAR